MSDVSIRGMDIAAVRSQNMGRSEGSSAPAKTEGAAAPTETSAVSQELQKLVDRMGSMNGGLTGTDRRLLQSGEGSLDEVRDAISRMGELLSGGTMDSAALRDALEALSREVDRMLAGASYDGIKLFGSEGEEAYAALAQDLASVLHKLVESAAAGQMPVNTDMNTLMDAIRQLMDSVAGGESPDQALFELTDSGVTSLLELAGKLTGEQDVESLLDALFAPGALPGLAPGDGAALAVPEGLEGYDLDLLLGLTSALGESAGAEKAAPEQVLRGSFGGFEVSGRDLSGVSYDPKTGQLTVTGDGEVTVRGGGEGERILLTGSGAVTLRDVKGSAVTAEGAQAKLLSAGENELTSIALRPGASLVLGGEGTLRVSALAGGRSNAVLVTGGAVTVADGRGDLSALGRLIVYDGASLAAQTMSVQGENGEVKSPLDLLLDKLLPGWSGIDSVTVDGKEAEMALWTQSDQARLWLEQGIDRGHGYPIHTVTITGRDGEERLRTYSAYVRWDERAGRFVEVVKYPNPFIVTGGAEGEDWRYDQYTQTLYLLTGEVTSVSGGPGVDAEEVPFSGKLAVESNIGELTLTLEGVSCSVPADRALDLGRENDITLWLAAGSENRFESGGRYAGVSVGDGTRLTIDVPPEPEEEEESGAPEEEPLPPGILSASGGDGGGAGIGRDSGGSWDRISRIAIRGGVVTATGGGGGAGIGAGKHGLMGDIEISGGRISAAGGRLGGAGIGGALGAPVGDIRVTGGEISATASYHAAAIGAGVEGECGAVYIGPRAKLLKAQGGDPGTDIGACVFGRSGEVTVEGGADTGLAVSKPGANESLAVRLGEELTLVRMQLTSKTLLLNGLNVAGWDSAWASKGVVNAAMRRVERLREKYGELYRQGEGASSTRDRDEAADLLSSASRSILNDPDQTVHTLGRADREKIGHLLQR